MVDLRLCRTLSAHYFDLFDYKKYDFSSLIQVFITFCLSDQRLYNFSLKNQPSVFLSPSVFITYLAFFIFGQYFFRICFSILLFFWIYCSYVLSYSLEVLLVRAQKDVYDVLSQKPAKNRFLAIGLIKKLFQIDF